MENWTNISNVVIEYNLHLFYEQTRIHKLTNHSENNISYTANVMKDRNVQVSRTGFFHLAPQFHTQMEVYLLVNKHLQ